MTASNKSYTSSLSIVKIAIAAGRVEEFRNALVEQLRAHRVDPTPALTNLPEGEAANAESVARLVDLARGHGLFVQLPNVPLDRGGMVRIVVPASVGMLQSGHHMERGPTPR